MYYIYVKLPTEKRFYPMSGAGITRNVIHAEIFRGDDRQAIAHAAKLESANPSMKFQPRRQDRKTVIQ